MGEGSHGSILNGNYAPKWVTSGWNSTQFLLYAESTALAGRKMTMASLHNQLDRLLQLNDYPVFDGWKDYLKDQAERHAKAELTLYKKRKVIESKGIKYDEEALAAGEYDEILIGN